MQRPRRACRHGRCRLHACVQHQPCMICCTAQPCNGAAALQLWQAGARCTKYQHLMRRKQQWYSHGTHERNCNMLCKSTRAVQEQCHRSLTAAICSACISYQSMPRCTAVLPWLAVGKLWAKCTCALPATLLGLSRAKAACCYARLVKALQWHRKASWRSTKAGTHPCVAARPAQCCMSPAAARAPPTGELHELQLSAAPTCRLSPRSMRAGWYASNDAGGLARNDTQVSAVLASRNL